MLGGDNKEIKSELPQYYQYYLHLYESYVISKHLESWFKVIQDIQSTLLKDLLVAKLENLANNQRKSIKIQKHLLNSLFSRLEWSDVSEHMFEVVARWGEGGEGGGEGAVTSEWGIIVRKWSIMKEWGIMDIMRDQIVTGDYRWGWRWVLVEGESELCSEIRSVKWRYNYNQI